MNVSSKTRMTPEEAMEHAIRFLVRGRRFSLVEVVGHLHGRKGAVEISVAGDPVAGDKAEYDPRQLLGQLVEHAQREFGLHVVHFILHLHAYPDESAGHLRIRFGVEEPTDVAVDSHQCDAPAGEFLDSLQEGRA